jgi:hypothetical protein
MTTISTGKQIILTHPHWDEDDVAVLLGLNRKTNDWGLLGNMGARGDAEEKLKER